MPQSSYVQSSFLGGEVAPTAQGAMHDPLYKISLDTCQNYIPLEEESITRRPGLKFAWVTKAGGVARNWTFRDAVNASYPVEAGGGYFRFGKNRALILEATTVAITSITTDTPAICNCASHPYNTNDYVMFTSLVGGNILRNRQFKITKLSGTQFTLTDPQSGAFVGTAVSGFVSGNTQRVYEITNPYDSGEIQNVYVLQDQNQQVMLHPSVAPTTLNRTAGTDTFSTATPSFIDGPYLDPPTDGSTLTPDAVVGTITLTASAITSINGGTGFVITDVGRAVRLFSEPPAWVSGNTYAQGALVKWQDNYWSSLKSTNTNHQPDLNLSWWALSPSSATWVWGTIAHWTDATHVVITTKPFSDGSTPSLLSTNAIVKWQLGLYSNTTGWPSCGVFHEGRLWLAGPASPNRFDGSRPDIHFDFAPTSPDGTVADDNAVDVTATSDDANPIFWMKSTVNGIVGGTAGGEFLIQASNLNDPITPTSVQIRKVTKFGSSSVRPAEMPTALAVLQNAQRKIYEYKVFIDISAYHPDLNGINMSRRARHLMQSGIAQLEYQRDPYTVLWGRRNDGLLVGASYERSPQRNYVAWHKQPLGGGTVNNSSTYPALVQSMAVVPSPDGFSEDLWCVVGRKVPGIVGPDATPNPPIGLTDTVIPPFFTQSGVTYNTGGRVQLDETSSEVFVSCFSSTSLLEGIAVYNLSMQQIVAAKIDSDGTGAGWAQGFPTAPLAISPGGQYIIGLQNVAFLQASRIFVLNRTTLAHVKDNSFGDPYQQLIAVDGAETFVFGANPTFFYAYHIPSGTSSQALWSTFTVLNQPNGGVRDATFDNSGNLWIGTDNGHLEEYTLFYAGGNITATKINSYVPHADGKGISKLTFNSLHNHILIWYDPNSGTSGPGRLTRWTITGVSVFADFTYPYQQNPTGLAGVRGWYAPRTNWHDNPVYVDVQVSGTGGAPVLWYFNATTGQSFSKLRSDWPGLDFLAETNSSFYNGNAHETWTGDGREVLSYDVGAFAVDDIGLGDGTTHYMEFIGPLQDFSTTNPKLAFFADSGRQDTDDAPAVTISSGNVTMCGLHYLEGETIMVHANGVDQGNFAVFRGQIVFPAPSGVTLASQLSLTIGYPYDSIGKTLPEAESGGANGPAAFKTRRNHKYALLLSNTQGISITEDDRNYMPDELRDEVTNQPTQVPALFSGRVREDMGGGDYTFRGKICWKQSRSYPGTINAVGGFYDPVDV